MALKRLRSMVVEHTAEGIAPDRFETTAHTGQSFGTTINCTQDIVALANKGVAYAAINNAALIQEAFDPNWTYPLFLDDWQLPNGAFGKLVGPS